jgi:FlaG/FlaF family flagellin (archaellin)
VTVTAVVVVAAAVISILVFQSMPGYNSPPTTPQSILHLDTTNPPLNIPPYSVKLYFGGFTQNVSWSDLRIDLTDGVSKVSWYPSTEGLSGGATISYCCGVGLLGSMTVTCNITDIIGAGIPLMGDSINLTATSDATFLATQNYTISVIYIPDGGFVCSLTFNGVPLVVSQQ